MTLALIDGPRAAAADPSTEIAHLERVLAQEQLKTHVAEERVVKAERETAGYQAVAKNLEAAYAALKARYESEKQTVRNLRTLQRERLPLRLADATGLEMGKSKALIVAATDDLAEGFVGRMGVVTAFRQPAQLAAVLTVEFPDHSVGKFGLYEVELDPQLIASLEAAS